MYDRTLAIYCFVDDLLKAIQHVEDARCEFSDSEVVTAAIVAMLSFGGNFERARQPCLLLESAAGTTRQLVAYARERARLLEC